jgi:GMP synthase-like glutamine amidotransferase
MKIGILQTGDAPDALRPAHGNYPDLFQRLLADQGFGFRTWRVLDMDFPASPHDAEGWLITGSRFGAYEDHAFIPPLEDFIRAVHAAGVPMVGICFGHQIIAQAMGGRVEKFPGGWSVGPTDYDFGGENLRLNAWHQDQVTTRPPGATLCATSPLCENAALLYGDRILTVQAHPEFDPAFAADMIERRGRGLVPDHLLDAAAARLPEPLDSPRLARAIGGFLRSGRLALPHPAESETA